MSYRPALPTREEYAHAAAIAARMKGKHPAEIAGEKFWTLLRSLLAKAMLKESQS